MGLWRHNVTIRSAREFINYDSTLTVSTNHLGRIVKWMKRYGDAPPDAEVHGEVHEKTPGEVRGEVREAETRYMQVSGAVRQRYTTEKTKQGERYISPPLRGGYVPPRDSEEEDELPIPW